MEDDRLPEKIEAVRQLLSERMGGQKVDYIFNPVGDAHRHLFRVGRRPTDHRLWLGREFVDALSVAELPARLKAAGVPALFARTTDHQIVWKDTNSRPTLVDRDD